MCIRDSDNFFNGGTLFGGAVSLAGDGNTLAVGALGEDGFSTGIDGDPDADNPSIRSGAVYVFDRSGVSWRQKAYVKASNTDRGDEFGSSVSLSLDANTLAVGAIGEESFATGINGDQADNSGRFAANGGIGAVYLY